MHVLDVLALNRALLARQLLLERVPMPVATALEQLVGMQAQEPSAPYAGLWTRLESFDPRELAEQVESGAAARGTLMRGTLHLATAADFLRLRTVMQPVVERSFWKGTPFGRQLGDTPVEDVLAAARALIEEEPRSRTELRPLLAGRFPGADPDALSYAAQYLIPAVQVPPRGVWGRSGRARLATVESFLGSAIGDDPAPDDVLLRYLAAFGPATVPDIATWSGWTGVAETVDRLRPRLDTYEDERGRELFDVPGAPLPDPATPAPIRFLPPFDNALLSHSDRSRIVPERHREAILHRLGRGSLLVDGFARGSWRADKARRAVTLNVELLDDVAPADREAIEEEAQALIGFLAPGAGTRSIAFVRADEG